METEYSPDLGKAERNSVLLLILIILCETEPPFRWEGPSTEVSTGEERGAVSAGCGKVRGRQRGVLQMAPASQESPVAGSSCSALTQCLGRTHCFNSSLLPSWVPGRTNEKRWAMLSNGHVRQEGEQRQRSN